MSHWRIPCDANSDLMVMSEQHPYWKAADAIRYRAGRDKCLRLRCGHRQLRDHAKRAVARWDAETERLVSEWKAENQSLMQAPRIERALSAP